MLYTEKHPPTPFFTIQFPFHHSYCLHPNVVVVVGQLKANQKEGETQSFKTKTSKEAYTETGGRYAIDTAKTGQRSVGVLDRDFCDGMIIIIMRVWSLYSTLLSLSHGPCCCCCTVSNN